MHGDEYRDQLAAAHAPEEHATQDAKGRVRSDVAPRARVESEQVTADEAREWAQPGAYIYQHEARRFARTVVALHAEADDRRAQVAALTADRDQARLLVSLDTDLLDTATKVARGFKAERDRLVEQMRAAREEAWDEGHIAGALEANPHRSSDG